MPAFGRRLTSTAQPPRTLNSPAVGTTNPNCLPTGAMQWANPSLSQLVTRRRGEHSARTREAGLCSVRLGPHSHASIGVVQVIVESVVGRSTPHERIADVDGEEILQGGVANAGAVVRSGDDVLRPSNQHSGSIHAFLKRIRAGGFRGAVRAGGDRSRRSRAFAIRARGCPASAVPVVGPDRRSAGIGRSAHPGTSRRVRWPVSRR